MIPADTFGYLEQPLGSGATALGSVIAAAPSFIKTDPPHFFIGALFSFFSVQPLRSLCLCG
jgi:hypothetical protein